MEEIDAPVSASGNSEKESVDDLEGKHNLKPPKVLLKKKGRHDGVQATSHHFHSEKNSKKSRTKYRLRKTERKGGAGGKGVWGAPGDESLSEVYTNDINDPNYDSNEESDVCLKFVQIQFTEGEIKDLVKPVILEYIETGLSAEVITLIKENSNLLPHLSTIIAYALEIGFDGKDSCRELISQLIINVYDEFYKQGSRMALQDAFTQCLANIEDLQLDCPNVVELLGKFMARAVADDCLAPAYIHKSLDQRKEGKAREVLALAERLLTIKHGLVRLDEVWGESGGNRPVDVLSKKFAAIIDEYISSLDLDNAILSITSLEVPHFKHELIYETIWQCMNKDNLETDRICKQFLKDLYVRGVVSHEQMCMGFSRIYDDLPGILLDIPKACIILTRFATSCAAEGIIPEKIAHDIPLPEDDGDRGHKRCLSESEEVQSMKRTDGGLSLAK